MLVIWIFDTLINVQLIFLFHSNCKHIYIVYIISKYNRIYLYLFRIMNIKGINIKMNRCVDAVENPELVTNCELEWVKIQLKDRKELLIGSSYMPHQNMEDV